MHSNEIWQASLKSRIWRYPCGFDLSAPHPVRMYTYMPPPPPSPAQHPFSRIHRNSPMIYACLYMLMLQRKMTFIHGGNDTFNISTSKPPSVDQKMLIQCQKLWTLSFDSMILHAGTHVVAQTAFPLIAVRNLWCVNFSRDIRLFNVDFMQILLSTYHLFICKLWIVNYILFIEEKWMAEKWNGPKRSGFNGRGQTLVFDSSFWR